MSDAPGRGIVRGPAANTSLCAGGKSNGVCVAESFRTCGTTSFFGRGDVDMVERLTKSRSDSRYLVFTEIDSRDPRKKEVVIRNVAHLYGEHPQQLQHLSPHEFVIYL